MTPESALSRLSRLARQGRFGRSDDAASIERVAVANESENRILRLSQTETRAVAEVVTALEEDERFEHIAEPKKAVLEFLAGALDQHVPDPVAWFAEKHTKSLEERICYVPIEYLEVDVEREVFGLRLLPRDHSDVPDRDAWFMSEEQVGCVAAVPTVGTNLSKMAARARLRVDRALRVVRIGLQAHYGIPVIQLRFRLGEGYSFGTRLGGFRRRSDMAQPLCLRDDLVQIVEREPLASLLEVPSNGLMRAADRAMRWMERAWFEGDQLVALLFLFFGFEALLGDRSEGSKAHGLAFRQAMVSQLREGGFTHPSETWWLYAKVRSIAVHGGDPPNIDRRTVDRFSWQLRLTLNGVLILATENNLTRRIELTRFLEGHADAERLAGWLRESGGREWDEYLARIHRSCR